MNYTKTFEEFKLNEQKSSSYDIALAFAKKHNIKYYIDDSGKFDKIAFTGSSKDFFNQKKKSKFVQVTKPTDFNDKTSTQVSIDVMIPAGGDSSYGIIYNVNKK